MWSLTFVRFPPPPVRTPTSHRPGSRGSPVGDDGGIAPPITPPAPGARVLSAERIPREGTVPGDPEVMDTAFRVIRSSLSQGRRQGEGMGSGQGDRRRGG